MRKKALIIIVAIGYGILCLFIGWLAGIDNGFDTGYRVAYLEMDRLLRQGMKDKVSFFIEGLDIKFHPHKDSKAIYLTK
ncbi:MAG TPA: hypothetical protein VF790_04160 [Dissulfurispiraceae bacterium]